MFFSAALLIASVVNAQQALPVVSTPADLKLGCKALTATSNGGIIKIITPPWFFSSCYLSSTDHGVGFSSSSVWFLNGWSTSTVVSSTNATFPITLIYWPSLFSSASCSYSWNATNVCLAIGFNAETSTLKVPSSASNVMIITDNPLEFMTVSANSDNTIFMLGKSCYGTDNCNKVNGIASTLTVTYSYLGATCSQSFGGFVVNSATNLPPPKVTLGRLGNSSVKKLNNEMVLKNN